MKKLTFIQKRLICAGLYVVTAIILACLILYTGVANVYNYSKPGLLSFGYILITALLFASCYFVVASFNKELATNIRKNGVICTIFALTTLFYLISVRFINVYLAPVFFCAFTMAILIGKKEAIIANVVLSLFYLITNTIIIAHSETVGGILLLFTVNVITGMFIITYKTTKINRLSFLLFGLLFGGISLIASVGFTLMFSSMDLLIRGIELYLFISAIVSSVLALAFVPLFEKIFNVVTDFRLLELCMNRTGLLKRLYDEAQGTYNHSTSVAHIAEACALKLDLDPYMARAAALFHDIGKLKQPNFFKENQKDDKNPHDNITPELSAEILREHTTYGRELAKEYRLPVEIQDITVEHHGTLPMKYFYFKAKQYTDGKPDLADYSYKGQLPQTKISGIIMISDGCEAAVRSIEKVTEESIREMVQSVVSERMTSLQLVECPLTLDELYKIEEATIDVLTNIYHTRIEYPDVEIPKE